jgi:hypothetical protein
VIVVVVLLTFAAVIAVVVVLVRKATKRQRELSGVSEAFAQSLAQLGAHQEADPHPARKKLLRWKLERGERSYVGHHLPHKNQAGYWLSGDVRAAAGGKVSAPFRSPGGGQILERMPRIRLRPENKRDIWGKRLRLNREVQTGDAAFDEAVYIESDATDDEVAAMLSSPRLREAVLALLSLGCSDVGLNYESQHVAAGWRQVERLDTFAGAVVDRALEQIAVIQDELPGFASVAYDTSSPRGTGFIVVAGIMASMGFLPATWGSVTYQPLGSKALVGIVVLVATPLFILACWLYVRRSSAALRALVWTAGLSILGVPLTSGGTTLALNGMLDSKRYEQRVTVIKRWISKSDDSTSYYIRVKPWPPHQLPVKIQVDQDDYERLISEQCTVRLGPGAFGIEWYDGVVSYD